jgi:hypothetical protein
MMSCHYLLVVTALRAGERAHLAGAEGGDDSGFVEVKDITALFTPLPEGDDRAPLVNDLTPRHLYRHRRSLLKTSQRTAASERIVLETPTSSPSLVVLIKQYGSWYIILNKEVRDRSAIANLPEI